MGIQTSPPGQSCQRACRVADIPLQEQIDQNVYQNFIEALEGITNYIPAKAIQNLIHIFGGSDLLKAIVFKDIRVISLSETRKCALIIPVPDMERFNPKPAFGGRTTYTWGLVRPQSRQLPPSSPKVSSDQQMGNEPFQVPTSDIWPLQH